MISKGADLTIRDGRGNDPLDDARREGRTSVIDYLINEALVRNFCDTFEDGVFNKGIQYTIGIFHKKFSDLQLSLSTFNGTTQMGYLGGSRYRNVSALAQKTDAVTNTTLVLSSTERIFEVFFSVQELYMHKVVEQLVVTLTSTY